jgi:two-component system, NarL family, response regulator LiaR
MRIATNNTKEQRHRPSLVGNHETETHNSVTYVEAFHNLDVNQLDYQDADEDNQIMFLVVDDEGRIISVNNFCEEELGYKINVLVGKSISIVMYKKHRRQIFDYMLDFMRSPIRIGINEFFMVRKDGSIFLANCYLFKMYDANGDKALLLVSERINESLDHDLGMAIDNELRVKSSTPKSTSLVLLTESAMLLEGVRKILDYENDVEVIAAGSSDQEIVPLVERFKPDVLIIDNDLLKLDIEEIMQSINGSGAETEVILILHSLDEEIVINALQLGVKGFVVNSTKSENLVQAIRFVVRGEIWGDIKLMKRVLMRLLETQKNNLLYLNHCLTKREREIARLVSEGYSNKVIAKRLSITVPTIKAHLYNIYKKLDINKRYQLIRGFQRRYFQSTSL